MIKKYTVLIFLLFNISCFGQDENKINEILNNIYHEQPSILAELYDHKDKEYDKSSKALKTNYLLPSTIESFKIKGNQLSYHNQILSFKSNQKASKDHRAKITTHPHMMFQWQFTIKEPGEYLIYQPSRSGASGLLNGKKVMNIHHNIISRSFSGSNFINLNAGQHQLYLLKRALTNATLKVINKKDLFKYHHEIYKKIVSTKKEDLIWLEQRFYPSLANRNTGISNYLIQLFKQKYFREKLKKNKDRSTKIFIEILKRLKGYDFYNFDNYLYENFKEYYFFHLKSGRSHRSILNNIHYGKGYRFDLINNYIYTNQPLKANQFISDYINYLKKRSPTSTEKMKVIMQAQLWLAYFYTGYFAQCNQLTSKFKADFEKFKKGHKSINDYFTVIRYLGVDPKPASKLIITDSTEKISALRIKDIIDSYKGDKEILKRVYEMFTEIKYLLIDFNNDFSSMRNIFVSSAFTNKLFLKEFRIYCLTKIQPRIKTAIAKNDINKMNILIKDYGDFLPLPKINRALFKEYFTKGDYAKAYYYAKLLYRSSPNDKKYVIAKLKVLEKINHTIEKDQTKISTKLLSHQFKHQGKTIKLKDLSTPISNKVATKAPGTLLKRISLPKVHSQYTNHPVIDFHQGAEVSFTSSTLFITTASSIQAIDLKTNKLSWSSVSKNEFHNNNERGPHQKRFISRVIGNNIMYFTNREYSGAKTVKCFDFKGELLWDLSGQSSKSLNPITTPILAGDALFSLSYNGGDTFKSLNFDVLDPINGKLIKTIPLAMIDHLQHDTHGGHVGHPWNTYRHDNHFVKDENAIYGYTGTGITFKASINSKELLWGKAFNRPNRIRRNHFTESIGSAPSGFIKLFKNMLVIFTPENQSFIGINKKSGKLIWRSLMYKPLLIHSRFSNKYIYFSDHHSGREPNLIKIDPQNGQMIWQRSFNGLVPKGEGQLHNGKIYIPCSKSIVTIDAINGDIIQVKKMDLQPLKLRYSKGYWVLFTSDDAFLLKADGLLDSSKFFKSPYPETGFIKPEKQTIPLPYGSLTLEKSLYLPERVYGTGDRWSKNKMIETSLPYHHIMKLRGHMTMFREGFEKKDGTYIAPTIMWYENIPFHFLMKDRIYISEPGEVRVEDLFTRNVIWSHKYQSKPHIYKRGLLKSQPVIAATKTHVAVQTIDQSIIILDAKSGKRLLTFNAHKARAIAICKNYVVISSGHRIYCYDINQFGKKIWEQYNPNRYELRQEEGIIFLLYYNNGYSYRIYDLKTGKFTYTLKPSGKSYNKAYREVHYKFGKDYSFAYYHLYDGKTGKVIKKYGEVHQVRNGGYFCFDKLYGNTGVYLDKGKSYKFKTTRGRGYNNPEIGILKKGNKIIVQAVYYIQTFEIKGDKLEEIHYIKNNAAKFGNHGNQRGMILYPLDNGLLEVRDSQMFFFRNFDPHHHFNKIESFRVKNKSNSAWPYSELYPPTKVELNQWVSNNKSKPVRTLRYQAFGDKKYAYLKINLSPLIDKKYKHKLFVSTNSAIGQGIVQWDPDEWKICSTNYIFKGRVISWKETDLDGNINLFLKFIYKETYHPSAKGSLPDFSIEVRQYKNGIDDGCYRIGGAFYHGPKFFTWNAKENHESQQLKNFHLRNNIYSISNFYPQGKELSKWIADRRKLYSIEENIDRLKQLIKLNKSNYCVINLLTTLLLEEIHLIRKRHPDLLEVTSQFQNKLPPLIKKVANFANGLNIKNEWRQFALTIWTAEIYPKKISISYNRNLYTKAVYNFSARGNKHYIYQNKSSSRLNPISPSVNIPYLEILSPGLLSGYPSEKQIKKLELYIGMDNSYVGNINQISPTGAKTLITSRGTLSDTNIKISHKLVQKKYYFNNKIFEVSKLIKSKRPFESLSITISPINVPSDKSFSGLSFKSVLNSLNNLPTDSKLSSTLIGGIIKKNKKLTLDNIEELYIAWLKRIKARHHDSVKACQYIHRNLLKRKDPWEICKRIFKKAKVNKNIQRSFNLTLLNQFGVKESRSILGPIEDYLDKNPEDQTNLAIEYESQKVKYKFQAVPVKSKKKSNSKFIYIALKVISPKRKKIYFISNVHEDYYNRGDEVISLWVNKKKKITATSFKEFDDHLISKKITLRKGENQILIKLEYPSKWNYLRYRFADLKGYPIEDLKFKSIHE